ncbi:MAG: hybrid sensor histidine kinase/response regulator [Verrucomicrobia bacterium]|nr:hybrid sensor histidine kinase/response regulator [Verrucomicrobiota bacterium]
MKILHLEDAEHDAELVQAMLAAEFPSCAVTVVASRAEFLAGLLAEPAPDLVLSDFSLPGFDGLSALALARERVPGIPFIFLSGSIGEERAITAVGTGAYDYVLKDNLARLPVAIRRALDDFAQRRRRKQDERRLLELAGIIERAAEAIVVADMTGRITLWNDGAARLYGIRAADAVGRPAEEILSHDAGTHLRAARDAAFETGEWQQELNITTRDGRSIVIDVRMTLVRDDAGRPSARLSIATDITERKKLEEQFLRVQRLESLGLLAAGISHDLNNVLAPVLMAAPLLRTRATAPEDLRVLDILEKSAERGSALVRQILGFAHGAGGGLRLTQVRHLLRDVTDVIGATFPKSIVLEQHIPTDLWPIQANPTQIHQIVLNLAVNARDAMLPRGGTLRLRAENRSLTAAEAAAVPDGRCGAFLMLEVSDTGTGMSAEVLARIWEPFFTTKGEGKGTGLGLATVRGIAATHGGFVTVGTRLGQGTTFRVFLPAETPAGDPGAAAEQPAVPRGHGELILVVDDEADVCHVAAAILDRHGYRTITCSDGIEAIAKFTERSTEIEVVLSDINMPNLDGPGLAVALRHLRPDVRIVAITGLGSGSAAPMAGADIFAATVSKPFTVDSLLGTLHRILQRGSARS